MQIKEAFCLGWIERRFDRVEAGVADWARRQAGIEISIIWRGRTDIGWFRRLPPTIHPRAFTHIAIVIKIILGVDEILNACIDLKTLSAKQTIPNDAGN